MEIYALCSVDTIMKWPNECRTSEALGYKSDRLVQSVTSRVLLLGVI